MLDLDRCLSRSAAWDCDRKVCEAVERVGGISALVLVFAKVHEVAHVSGCRWARGCSTVGHTHGKADFSYACIGTLLRNIGQ